VTKVKKESIQQAAWDVEWAQDWKRIVAVYDAIDKIAEAFAVLESDLPYLRVLTQHQLLLNLEKYALTLQSLIVSKYRDE
jgi:hypothetical protein